MDFKHFIGAAVVASAVALIAGANPLPPLGWYYSTTDETAYEYRAEPAESGHGKIATITSKTIHPTDFASIEKRIDVTPYRGKLIKVAAYIDGQATGTVSVYFSFRNADGNVKDGSFQKPGQGATHEIHGGGTWTTPVPPEAVQLNYGVLLQGPGTIRVPLLKIEVEEPPPAPPIISDVPFKARAALAVPSLN